MRDKGTVLTRRACVLATALTAVLGLGVCLPSSAADSADESARLAAMVRQLETLELLAEHSAKLSEANGSRYHFDYARLNADINRIRAGIQDFISPLRAQPRDPAPVSGDYRHDTDDMP